MQYTDDKKRFAFLLSKFTRIKESEILDCLKENNVKALIENPTILKITEIQRQKFFEIKELHNLIDNLKLNEKQYVLRSSSSARDYFKNYLKDLQDKERFACAFLDNSNRVISTKIMSAGTVNESPVYPREIAKEAVLCNAASVILAHNHPGGSESPSQADVHVTNRIVEALATLSIKCADHIIVTDISTTSLAERGLISSSPDNRNSSQESQIEYTIDKKNTISNIDKLIEQKKQELIEKQKTMKINRKSHYEVKKQGR